MARRHNDANVLALAGRRLSDEPGACDHPGVPVAQFEGGRHQRRVDQIARIENGGAPTPAEPLKEAT